MTFLKKLETRQKSINSNLCIGLDPSKDKIPKSIVSKRNPLFEFNRAIVDATFPYACSYKPQIAYYAATRAEDDLEMTIDYIHEKYPDIPVILDAKRSDISSTAEMYAREAFERYKADAVTVNPYLGYDSVKPFIEWKEKGVIILCKTSNPSSHEIQDVLINGKPLYINIAERAIKEWNVNQNICFVVGATYPSQMLEIRRIAPDTYFLVPGLGTQGGSIREIMNNGVRSDGLGVIISSSRSIIHASEKDDFAQKAKEAAFNYFTQIQQYWR